MKGQVLHLMELHFFMEGVFKVGVFVCFSLTLTIRSRRFHGRLYAMKGRSEKLLCSCLKIEHLQCEDSVKYLASLCCCCCCC